MQTPNRHARYLVWRDHRDETPALLRRRLRRLASGLRQGLAGLTATLALRRSYSRVSCASAPQAIRPRLPAVEPEALDEIASGSSLPESSSRSDESRIKLANEDAAGDADHMDEDAAFLLAQYRKSMVHARPETDHELLEEAVQTASGGSVWGTSCPYNAALCKPYFVWALSGMGAALLASLTQCVLQVAADNARPVRHVRFTALQLRSGAAGAAVVGPGIDGLTLLHRSCRLPFLVFNDSLPGSEASWRASLPREALVNGWAFSTPIAQPPELDPVSHFDRADRFLR